MPKAPIVFDSAKSDCLIQLGQFDISNDSYHNRLTVPHDHFDFTPGELLTRFEEVRIMGKEFLQGVFNGKHVAIIERRFCVVNQVMSCFKRKCLQ